MIQSFVRSTLSLTFVVAAARVVFNIKARMARETSLQLELKGDLTKQRRVEAVDNLLSVMTLLVSLIFGLQALGLDGKGFFPHPVCCGICHHVPELLSTLHSTPCCLQCRLLFYQVCHHSCDCLLGNKA